MVTKKMIVLGKKALAVKGSSVRKARTTGRQLQQLNGAQLRLKGGAKEIKMIQELTWKELKISREEETKVTPKADQGESSGKREAESGTDQVPSGVQC
ncbi:unnamed protein product [Urochloa humidicola]